MIRERVKEKSRLTDSIRSFQRSLMKNLNDLTLSLEAENFEETVGKGPPESTNYNLLVVLNVHAHARQLVYMYEPKTRRRGEKLRKCSTRNS